MAELADALDLGSSGLRPWGFDSPRSHHSYQTTYPRVGPWLAGKASRDLLQTSIPRRFEVAEEVRIYDLDVVANHPDVAEEVDVGDVAAVGA